MLLYRLYIGLGVEAIAILLGVCYTYVYDTQTSITNYIGNGWWLVLVDVFTHAHPLDCFMGMVVVC